MPTTSNFGWTTPADTDLVKDGAAAIRTLGNGIDTSLVDLKGGTTGQILSKNSNTDLDYIWINNDQGDITAVTAGTGLTGGGTTGAVTLTNDMATTITAAGDIVVGTGSGTYDNLPIGTTGQVLTADTTVSPYKVKWAAASSGAVVQVKSATTTTATSNATSTYADTGLSLSITPTSASNKILVIVQQYLRNDNTSAVYELGAYLRIMRDSTAIYNDNKVIFYSKQGDEAGYNGQQHLLMYLDSPATTSSVTYKTQQKIYSTTVTAQENSTPSSITLMEVTP